MWKFHSGTDLDGTGKSNPQLFSLNGHQGRSTWVWDKDAGTPEQRAAVKKLQDDFTKNRLTQKNGSDALLRTQFAPRRRVGPFPVDSAAEGEGGSVAESAVSAGLRNGISFFEALQCDEGHWAGDYGGPMFLMPGLVIALYTMGKLESVLPAPHRAEMVRYLRNHCNEDGGFGLHIEGGSTMFGTVLSYVTLRLLGVGPADPVCSAARTWMHARGGAVAISSWGKFWLSLLGVYAWEGQNPMPPEMWLLPYSAWTGVGWGHPGRFWCHCRMVYLPMSYLYGRRATAAPSALTEALKTELYVTEYARINWDAARNTVAAEDLYYPHPKIQDLLWWTLSRTERWLLGSRLRGRALAECLRHIRYEDRNTRYVDIGPVNKVMDWLCVWFDDPAGEDVARHEPRIHDYLWVAEDGMKMQGYNGAQLWDTAFAVQAVAGTGLAGEFAGALKKAHSYVEASQVVEEAEAPLSEYYRHVSLGAWPFSTRDHGWPISDCSSEGLKAALVLAGLTERLALGPAIPLPRLLNCVDVILSYQNGTGGWATYENTRSFALLELVNPAETFGDIMIDYDYVECSSACITALAAFKKAHPGTRADAAIDASIARGVRCVRGMQRPDGSWYGNWAVCFTYGTWFGLDALAVAGESASNSDDALRACRFLLAHSRADGGWAETYRSCSEKAYAQLLPLSAPSHAVCTAWALLALMAARYEEIDAAPLHAAARCLLALQAPDGDWAQQTISGVFNRNCMISYTNYRNTFPIWALGKYRTQVLRAGRA